jgi:hypothetical protein
MDQLMRREGRILRAIFQQALMIPTDSDFNQCLRALQAISHFGFCRVLLLQFTRIR